MGRPNFGQPVAPSVLYHLHDDGDAVNGDTAECLQHGLPVEILVEAEAKPTEFKLVDPLGFRWRVPLSWDSLVVILMQLG